MSTAKMHKFSETGEVLAKTRPPPGHDHVSSGLLMPTFGWVVGWVLVVWIGGNFWGYMIRIIYLHSFLWWGLF